MKNQWVSTNNQERNKDQRTHTNPLKILYNVYCTSVFDVVWCGFGFLCLKKTQWSWKRENRGMLGMLKVKGVVQPEKEIALWRREREWKRSVKWQVIWQ